jgi:hypothetical protein
MNSRAKRTTSAKERAPFPRIAEYFRMGSPPAVLEAGTRLGKSGGLIDAARLSCPSFGKTPVQAGFPQVLPSLQRE